MFYTKENDCSVGCARNGSWSAALTAQSLANLDKCGAKVATYRAKLSPSQRCIGKEGVGGQVSKHLHGGGRGVLKGVYR